MRPSNNHLCNALPTQRLAPHEALPFQSSNEVADRGKQQDHGCSNQACWKSDDAEELDEGHGAVYARSHVVCRKPPDESIEVGGGWADAEE